MEKDDNIKLSGFVYCTVDAVDIEQAEIEHPGIADMQAFEKAFVAARAKEGVKRIERACAAGGQALYPDEWNILTGGKYQVTFIIRDMKPEEAAA